MIIPLAVKLEKNALPSSSAMTHQTNSSTESRLSPSPAKETLSIRVKRWFSSKKKSKAMGDQLATVSKLRLLKRAGVLSEEDLIKIGETIKLQLDIF